MGQVYEGDTMIPGAINHPPVRRRAEALARQDP